MHWAQIRSSLEQEPLSRYSWARSYDFRFSCAVEDVWCDNCVSHNTMLDMARVLGLSSNKSNMSAYLRLGMHADKNIHYDVCLTASWRGRARRELLQIPRQSGRYRYFRVYVVYVA